MDIVTSSAIGTHARCEPGIERDAPRGVGGGQADRDRRAVPTRRAVAVAPPVGVGDDEFAGADDAAQHLIEKPHARLLATGAGCNQYRRQNDRSQPVTA